MKARWQVVRQRGASERPVSAHRFAWAARRRARKLTASEPLGVFHDVRPVDAEAVTA